MSESATSLKRAVPVPVARLAEKPYARKVDPRPIDLRLDANEGLAPPAELLSGMTLSPAIAGTYPSVAALEAELAAHWGVDPARIVVTAGADDALERICRVMLEPGREVVLTDPTFEMIPRWAAFCGATIRAVPWMEGPGAPPFPTAAMEALVSDRTAAIFVVSPNNPTGLTGTVSDVRRLSDAAPSAIVVADLAYVEFADEDMTRGVLGLPNVVVTRTFSKAWGLAGLRVGYAIAPEPIARCVRTVGLPYACSGYSAAVALRWWREGQREVESFTTTVRRERDELARVFSDLGVEFVRSQANFLLARFRDAACTADLLAGMGIAVRRNAGALKDWLRISIPGNDPDGSRLREALEVVLCPQAILFDMDGVLADVSGSYRETIVRTCAGLGATVTRDDIAAVKALGNANNDWVVTRRLLADRGVNRSLEEVTAAFEAIYQGTSDSPGLRSTERLLIPRDKLQQLKDGFKLGIVTGRPRADAERFLREQGIADLFSCVVCMEDAPLKPRPDSVNLARERLGAQRVWFIGDTPDDIAAARAARALPVGCVAPGDDPAKATDLLLRTGAGRVLTSIEQLPEILP